MLTQVDKAFTIIYLVKGLQEPVVGGDEGLVVGDHLVVEVSVDQLIYQQHRQIRSIVTRFIILPELVCGSAKHWKQNSTMNFKKAFCLVTFGLPARNADITWIF